MHKGLWEVINLDLCALYVDLYMSQRKIQFMLTNILSLLLVATRAPAAAGPFKFAALGTHEWLGVRVWHSRSRPEVFHGFSGIATALHQHCLAASGGPQSQLIESDNFTT